MSANETEPGAFRLYEAWVQQSLAGDAFAVKAEPCRSLNTTFDVQETAALFLQRLAGDRRGARRHRPQRALELSHPGRGGDRVLRRPRADWTVQLGLFDATAGNPNNRAEFVDVKLDGALIIAQAEKRLANRARAEIGVWTYTRDYPVLGLPPGEAREGGGDAGVYGLLEGRIIGGGDGPGLSGWVRTGLANGELNPVANYLGAGLVYTGPLRGRDKDEVGIAIARAGFGPGAKRAAALAGERLDHAETDLEATYRYVLTDWLNIQPDMQYVIDPHGIATRRNALVGGLRLAFSYTR